MAGKASPAVDRDLKRVAHFTHLVVSEPSEPLDENANRDALDGVKAGNTR